MGGWVVIKQSDVIFKVGMEKHWCLLSNKTGQKKPKKCWHSIRMVPKSKIVMCWKKKKTKDYIERRHGEPSKFLFLPRMGLLGSQASMWKKVQFWIKNHFFSSVFSTFHGQKVAFALKSCLIEKWKKFEKKFGTIFFGKKMFFLG